MNIYELLENLNIKYEEISHKAVYTIEEALKEDIPSKINGIECKNLFFHDAKKKNYYLVFMKCDKKCNLKELSEKFNISKLSFASPTDLQSILNLTPGSVTPLGIINDKENKVTILIDQELKNKQVLVHPNVNTKTISLNELDLIKIFDYFNTKYIYF